MCYQSPLDSPERFYYKELDISFYFSTKEPKINAKEIISFLNSTTETSFTKFFKLITNSKNSETNEIVKVKTVFVKNILNTGNKDTLLFFEKISRLSADNKIFGNDALAKVINYKWETYGRKSFFTEFFVFILFMIIYLSHIVFALPSRIQAEKNNEENLSVYLSLAYFFDLMLLIFALYYIYEETWQMKCLKFIEYIRSLWNIIDICLIFGVISTSVIDVICCINHEINDSAKTIYSATIFLAFIRLISFARGLEKSAFMVRLILKVIIDIKYFLMLMIVFIFSLGCSGNNF